MDPDTMPAGPELDVLVAEKVMGWKRGRGWFDSPTNALGDRWFDAEGNRLGDDHATPEGHGGGDSEYPDQVWSPSTDIAAAWEVVEKLNSSMLRRDARRDTSGRYDHGCFFHLERNALLDAWAERTGRDPLKEPRPPEPWHYADTAPLAICRAALKAVASCHD